MSLTRYITRLLCHNVFTLMQARSTKAKARVDAYGVLVEKARDTPTADLRVDFGRVGMARLGE
jgi:hypothetical protein